MDVFFIDIWMTVSDYNTNPTVIILVGIGIRNACFIIDIWKLYQTSNYTVIILVGIGILSKWML